MSCGVRAVIVGGWPIWLAGRRDALQRAPEAVGRSCGLTTVIGMLCVVNVDVPVGSTVPTPFSL